MKGLLLTSDKHTKLMPGDRIVFTPQGDGLEIVDYYRGGEKLYLVPPYLRLIGGDNEFPRRLMHVERTKIAKNIAAATGMKLRVVERGERRTIFQFI
ncbi:MAG: hypothetical protein Q8N56_01300 [bacterium]|nr:hypothetical protein [bacterium]